MSIIVKCPICGTIIEDEPYTECSYCGWGYTGVEVCYDLDEKEDYNLMSMDQAKELVAKGLNIWGEPLPKGPETK